MRAPQNGYNPPETRLTKGCRDHMRVLHPDRLLAIFVTIMGDCEGHSAPPFAKVGYTSDGDRRIAELQAGNPHKLKCQYTFWVANRHRSEQEAHRALDAEGLRLDCGGGREWFRVDDGLEDIAEFAEIVRAAIFQFMQEEEEEEEDLDLAESAINLAPNQ